MHYGVFKMFDYTLNFAETDFRKEPEKYRVGKGEQGVLLVQPYKSELLPHWRFKEPQIAKKSAATIYKMFLQYKKESDFVGMDMARKFLQMGYTRARRYANHKSGKKYDGPVPGDKKGVSGAHVRPQLPRMIDTVKAESAAIFYTYWQKAKGDKKYLQLMKDHKQKWETKP